MSRVGVDQPEPGAVPPQGWRSDAPGAGARAQLAPIPNLAMQRHSVAAQLPRLLLVAAPTGYGKSTFLAWLAATLESQGRRSVLLRVDERTGGLEQVLDGLERVLACSRAVAGMMFCAGPAVMPETRLEALIAAAATLPAGSVPVLLFDGVDPRRDAALCSVIESLLLEAAARICCVVAMTESPPGIFRSIRMRGDLVECRSEELAFGRDGISAMLCTGTGGLPAPSQEQIDTILARTEGWPAALRLLQAGAASGLDWDRMLAAGSGFEDQMARGLLEHVLVALPTDLLRFVEELAGLYEFCAGLCEFALEEPAAARLIERIVDLNLMVFPSDAEPGWLRFHALFARLLQPHAQADVATGRRETILSRAALWCDRHGRWQEAFDYALAAGDAVLAGQVLERHGETVVRKQGRLVPYMAAYERLPSLPLAPPADARYWYLWALMFGRRNELAHRLLGDGDGDAALRSLDAARLTRQDLRLECLRIVILFSLDRVTEARMRGEAWLEQGDQLDPFETSSVACAVAAAAIAGLEFAAARRAIALARRAMTRDGSEYGLAWVACLEALIDLEEGDLAHADHAVAAALERACLCLKADAGIVASLNMMSVRIAFERGEIRTIPDTVWSGLHRSRQHGLIETVVPGFDMVVRAWSGEHQAGQVDGAIDALEEIAADFPVRLGRLLACQVLVRMIRSGHGNDAALEWARRHDLARVLDAPLPAGRDEPVASLRRAEEYAAIALLCARRCVAAAGERLERAVQASLRTSAAVHTVRLLLWSVQLQAAEGRTVDASRQLMRALSIAAPRGVLQPFLEAAAVVAPLVRQDPSRRWPLAGEAERAMLERIRALLACEDPANETVPDSAVAAPVERPTARELELLALLDAGLSNQQVAERSGLSIATVKWHLHNLFGKFKVRSRAGLLARARALGLLAR